MDSKFESHDPIAGVLRLSFSTIPQYANPAGMVMGGIVAAFLDGSMGPLVAAANGGTKVPISTDLHTQFFKGVPIGPRCIVEARIDRMGRNIVFTSTVVLNAKGDICTKAVHTAMVIDAPKL